jgi:hypothetical protein
MLTKLFLEMVCSDDCLTCKAIAATGEPMFLSLVKLFFMLAKLFLAQIKLFLRR